MVTAFRLLFKILFLTTAIALTSCNKGSSSVDTSLLPKLTPESIEVTESAVVRVPIRLSAPANERIAIEFTTTGGTATQDIDYQGSAGTFYIEPGDEAGFIEITTVDDSLNELPETFQVFFTNVSNALLQASSVEVTIADNDAMPNLTINDMTVAEGDNVTLTFTLSAATGRDVILDFETQNIVAVSGADYNSVTKTGYIIPKGQTTGSVSISTVDDTMDENDETFKIYITSGEAVNIIDSTSVITVTDNDAPPTVSISDASVNEGSNAQITVSINQASGKAIAFDWITANGTSLAPGDYFAGSGSAISIPAGSTSVTLVVTTVDDTLTEVAENFTVTISNPSNATLGNPLSNVTLVDNDVIPTVSVGAAVATEGGNISFPVTLSAVSGLNVSVNYATSNSTALAGSDYTAGSSTLTIPAGSASGNIIVATTDDLVDEVDETFSVTISTPVNSTLGTVTATATISDNDSPPAMSIDDVTVAEGNGTSFTVTLSVASQKDVSFDWTTSDNTALGASDFNVNSGSVTIPAGSTTATLNVTTIEDASYEVTESFRVTLSNVVNATLADNTGVATVTDDDTAPVITIGDVVVAEGTSATLTVTLTGATSQTTTLNWTTVNGTAIAPSDYTFASGSLSFAPGETTKSIVVTTIDDTTDEANQIFTVDLSSPINATISDTSGQVTLTDNDAAPTLSVADLTVTEGGTATFNISLSAISEQAVTFDWSTLNATALSGSDYTTGSGTALTIAAGSLGQTINVVTLDDSTSEVTETFSLDISNPSNATIADASGVASITDNEGSPVLSINDVTVVEGAVASFTVTSSATSSQNITVNFTTVAGTATAVTDYTATSGTATIVAGTTTTTISVTTIDNAEFESTENYTISLSGAANATITDGTGAGSITDNDPQPTISIDDVTVTEGTSAVFTVTLSSTPGSNVSVSWATANNTAVSPGDYTGTSGNLIINAGSTTGTITIPTINDTLDENAESFYLNLSAPTNATISDAQGVATVNDDDAAPNISINNVVVTEGSNAVYTVSLDTASGKTVTFNWATADGSAVNPEDYTANSNSGSIAIGSTSTTITVVTNNDIKDENNDETFDVILSGVVDATVADGTGTTTLTDNDTPSLSINDVTVAEGGNLVFTVTSDRPSVNTLTVDWATATGTALNVADFTADSGTATITPGNTTTTITIATVDNTAYEIAETMTINLSAAVGAVIGDTAGTGTITDGDAAPTLAINDVTTTESGNLNFTVTLTGDTEVAAGFSWAASSGTATVVSDFPTSSGTGSIPAGSTTTSIVVGTLDDALNENDETLNVTLTVPTNSTLLDNIGVGTIQDNDGIPVINIGVATSVEAASATFTVTLSAVSGRAVTVDWATSSGTATSGSDFNANSGTLTFAAGVTTQTIVITTIEDAVVCEGDETYDVTLSNPGYGTLGTAVGAGTIRDNDPTLSVAPATAVEGVTADFVVTQSAICGSDVTFNWATTVGTALSPADFTTASGTGTITSGNTTATINIATTADAVPEVTEAFTMTISTPVNATIVTATATGTITDDDAIPDITIADASITEGSSLSFVVTLSAAVGSNVTFNYASSAVTATAGTDYTTTSGVGTITAGNLTTTITVPTTAETMHELDETINMTISAANLGNITDNVGVGTITNNDAVPNMTITDVSAAEGSNLVFTVNLNQASYQSITFDYATSDSTAVNPEDYASASATGVIIPSGSTSQTITIAAIDDANWEPSQTFQVVISNAVNANIVDSTGLGTITENDAAPTLAINDVSVAESGTATFTVTMNKLALQDVTFNWATSGSTATSGTDFTAASGTAVTITAGTLTKTFDVVTLDDAVYEANETYNITLSGATVATIADATGVGTITDNDTIPTIAIDDPAAVVEGNTITFTITQSAASGSNTTASWATSSGTATGGSDYTTASGTATITAGNTTTTVVVTTLNDSVIDTASETFTVTLSAPSNATISDATGTGTISDNEPVRLNQSLVSGGNVTNYRVSTDGAKAVYISDAETDGKVEIYSVNTDGTTRVKLNSALVSGGNVIDFAISADSSKVVFIADLTTDEVYELYSVALDGSSLQKINAALVSGGDVSSFLISADSANVVYLADKDVDNMVELYQVAISGGSSTQISDSALIAAGDVTQYSISANSSKVVYIADRDVDEDYEVFSVNITGGASTQLNRALVASGDISSFLISANSSSVVYIGDMDVDASVEIYSVAIGGGAISDLNGTLITGGNVQSYQITPDSAKVVYIADADVDNDNEIFSVNMAGTGLVQLNSALTTGGDIVDFKISASSARVIYRGDQDTDNKIELYSVTPAGASLTKISATIVTNGNVTDFAISANSSNVVYIADVTTDEIFDLYTTSSTAASNTKINGALVLGGDVTSFQIAPNSAKVFFRADVTTNDVFEVFKVDIGGTGLTKVNGTLPSGGNISSGIISDDSSKIIYLGDQLTDAVIELFGVTL